MNPFKKLCKHAQSRIDQKWLYSEKEHDDCKGLCWKCDGPLHLEKPHKPHIAKTLQQEMDEDPKVKSQMEAYFAESDWSCPSCFKKMLEASLAEVHLGTPLKDIITDLKNPNGEWVKETEAMIKSVEECGPDCPDYEHLVAWNKRLESRNEKGLFEEKSDVISNIG